MSADVKTTQGNVIFDAPLSPPETESELPSAEKMTLDAREGDTTANKVDDTTTKRKFEHTINLDVDDIEGLQNVALTPVGEDFNKQLGADSNTSPASPPLVLKSIPSTPMVDKSFTNGEVEAPIEEEDDPRNLVISSLRTQISDLFSQVALLNSKLVQSYERVSSLEETLDENSEQMRALVGEKLNLERELQTQEIENRKHEEMLRDGRLVERTAVAAELNRLMEQTLASSDAQRTAEAKHAMIESELSDLSAQLFSSANEMVAKERKARAAAEQSLVNSESQRKQLESVLQGSQKKLEDNGKMVEGLKHERLIREQELDELKKVVDSMNSINFSSTNSGVVRMMNSHPPFKTEYLGFISHLRDMARTTLSPPSITSVLTLPFLQRLVVEDSEPTLRLDLAPSLNWLSRRSVLSAIHSNSLLIDQIHVATLFLENSATTYSYSFGSSASSLPTSPTQLTKVNCALCGKVVYMSPEAIQAEKDQYQPLVVSQSPVTPTPASVAMNPPSTPPRSSSNGGWNATRFLKNVNIPSLSGSGSSGPSTPTAKTSSEANAIVNGTAPSPSYSRSSSPPPPTSLQTLIHAFRVPTTNRSSTVGIPGVSTPPVMSENYGQPFPLCPSGWCHARLKTTCDLWSFVREGVMDRVWKEARTLDIVEKVAESNARDSNRTSDDLRGGADPGLRKDLHTQPAVDQPSDLIEKTSPLPLSKRKMPSIWGMGKEVFDKAIGGSNPSKPTESSTPGPGLFGSMKRSLSSSMAPNSSTESPMVPEKDSVALQTRSKTEPVLSDPFLVDNTVSSPPNPLPPGEKSDSEKAAPGDITIKSGQSEEKAIPEVKDGLENISESKALVDPATSPGNTLPSDSSVSLDAFVTPSETPAQGLSPVIPETSKEPEVPPSLPTTLAPPVEANGRESKTEDIEPPTPRPNSVGFSKIGTIKTEGKGHQRNTSVSSIRSDGSNSRTPRPSTPNNAQASPRTSMIGKPSSSSRPSTPNKSGVPPPVPRRAAARNAPKSNVTPVKQRDAVDKGRPSEKPDKTDPAESKPAIETAPTTEGTKNKSDTNPETVAAPLNEDASEGADKVATTVPISANATTEGEVKPEDSQVPTGSGPVPPNEAGQKENSNERDDISKPEGPIENKSNVSTPKSISVPLPAPEMPSPTTHPLPSASPTVPKEAKSPESSKGFRPRQDSVASASSVYSPSVYTTTSNLGGPEKDTQGPAGRFYVGRSSWEERAWLELVRIRESMFWARLGGVRQ